ncbi:MAG: hypothetical protein M3Z95_07210 [Actinomycetota bacterium]|nr:hypothetical protein [Actinomycetota bacterium]
MNTLSPLIALQASGEFPASIPARLGPAPAVENVIAVHNEQQALGASVRELRD